MKTMPMQCVRTRAHNFSFLLLDDENNPESKLNSISTLASAIVHIRILGGFVGIAKVTNVAIMCILRVGVCVCARECVCGSRFSSSTEILYAI